MKKYTLSTMLFDTSEDAVAQLKKFIDQESGIKEGTKILVVTEEIPFAIDLDPVITLEKAKKI